MSGMGSDSQGDFPDIYVYNFTVTDEFIKYVANMTPQKFEKLSKKVVDRSNLDSRKRTDNIRHQLLQPFFKKHGQREEMSPYRVFSTLRLWVLLFDLN